MKILLLGATGRTGIRIVEEAARRGDEISAIARDPGKLSEYQIDITRGTPYEEETVETVIAGCDAVINVLNISRKSDNPWASLRSPRDLISQSAHNALTAMEQVGINRFIALSTIGAGRSWQNIPWLLKAIVSISNLKYPFRDHGRQEEILENSPMDYTICRAPMLTDDEAAAGAVATPEGTPPASRVLSRSAAAEFFLDIIEDSSHIREVIHLSNKPD